METSCRQWITAKLVEVAFRAHPPAPERPVWVDQWLKSSGSLEEAAKRSMAVDLGLPYEEPPKPPRAPITQLEPVNTALSPATGASFLAPWCDVDEGTANVWWKRSRAYRGTGEARVPTRRAGVTPAVLYVLDGLASGALPLVPPEGITMEHVRVLMTYAGVTGPRLHNELGYSLNTIYAQTTRPVRLYASVLLLGMGHPVNPAFTTDWQFT